MAKFFELLLMVIVLPFAIGLFMVGVLFLVELRTELRKRRRQ